MPSQHSNDMHPVSVAFSGPDNTGKTKQIGILARRMGPAATFAGPLDHYDPRWATIKADGMARWWFKTGPVEEVADVLATSYLERSRHPFSAPVRLLDRGIPMLEASVAATVAVRENVGTAQAATGPGWPLTRPTCRPPSRSSCPGAASNPSGRHARSR
ncbi:hypothetical protein [Streptomyces triculaminicus]|uniref:hypothetical protein n=1 Tax=Streptomyces triculaminicus TaxID=2816232 RepID=UPI0037B42417